MKSEPDNPVNRVIAEIIKARSAQGTSGPVDLDAAIEAAGGEAAARWRQGRAENEAFHREQDARNAELDSLPLEEVRSRAIQALDHAVALLRQTPLDQELRRHGWSERFATGLADECAKRIAEVENGTYEKEWGGAGLGRWLLDEISPYVGDEDEMQDSIFEAQFLLEAYSRRLPERG